MRRRPRTVTVWAHRCPTPGWVIVLPNGLEAYGTTIRNAAENAQSLYAESEGDPDTKLLIGW